MMFLDRPLAFQIAAVGAASASVDPLAALSDTFAAGAAALLDRDWLRRDDTTTPAGDGEILTLEREDGAYLLTIDAGGAAGSIHFNNNRGVSWVKAIDAALWGVESRITLRNAADDGDPPNTNFRLGGLIVQDEYTTNVDEVALLYGSAGSSGTVGPRVYRHHTVEGVTGTSGADVPGWEATTNLTGAERWLRILRDRDDSDRWVLQYSSDGVEWATHHDIQRGDDAMPDEVFVGMALWSDQATHDIACRFHGIRFFTPTEDDFP